MPHFKLESTHTCLVAGVDEAGRGPWAGPVVASAVIFKQYKKNPRGIDDSKKLSRDARETLFDQIMEQCFVGVGEASCDEIDALNIWGATSLAMRRAIAALPEAPSFAYIDGKIVPKQFPCAAKAVVKGDSVSYSIAAASIVAKVTRDRIMQTLAKQYPQYGFERHAGYGTAIHQRALDAYGPCAAHRKSFAPIARLLEAA